MMMKVPEDFEYLVAGVNEGTVIFATLLDIAFQIPHERTALHSEHICVPFCHYVRLVASILSLLRKTSFFSVSPVYSRTVFDVIDELVRLYFPY